MSSEIFSLPRCPGPTSTAVSSTGISEKAAETFFLDTGPITNHVNFVRNKRGNVPPPRSVTETLDKPKSSALKQHEVVPVMNGADDRTLLLTDGSWQSIHPFLILGTCFFHFRCSFAFHSAFHRVFLQANPALPSSSFRALRAIMCYIHHLYGSL